MTNRNQTLAERLKSMTPLQRAVFALKETQARLAALERQRSEPIAIVGMSCRFPGGANDPESFWRLLCDSVDAVRVTPPERWDADALYDPDPAAPGKMNSRCGGYLDRIDEFDNHFFGISDREAMRIDPQQRLLLELAWEALEDAGLPPAALRGSKTGVFIGISVSDYAMMLFDDFSQTDAHAATGTSLCLAANRLSFAFGFQGPSLALDTACSSSLVAVHLACQLIRNGECEAALAGGSSLLLSPVSTMNLTKAGFCAADGRVRAFDAAATGYVRGEGAGLVVLKPLSAALQNRDPVHAIIRGSAVNQNGTSNGLTAPSRAAQEQVLREAYCRAGVSPGHIHYVETQGTGTRLGDAIEALALGDVLREGRPPGDRCAIGSVKTNIGHLEAASGIASLMKVALSLQHRQLVPSLHFQTPNPDIPFSQLPLRVQTAVEPWPQALHPRQAGVSAFGFGGSNAHVVLEEAPAPGDETAAVSDERQRRVLPLSARSEGALQALVQRYSAFLERTPAAWSDICYTAARRRDHHDCRVALVADSGRQALERLRGYVAGESHADIMSGRKPYGRNLKVAFVFGDDPAPWRQYLPHLARGLPGFAEALAAIDVSVHSVTGWPLASLLREDACWRDPAQARPALLGLQLALTAWWRASGVTPDAVLGRGAGELAAACAAGILTPQEALRFVVDTSPSGDSRADDTWRARPAALPFFSSVDGGAHAGPELGDAHWRSCLQTAAGWSLATAALDARRLDVHLEMGPAALSGTGDRQQPGRDSLALSSLSQRDDDSVDALAAVVALYTAGAGLHWQRLSPADGHCVRLPTYAWQRQRLWVPNKKWQTTPVPDAAGGPKAAACRARPELTTPYLAPRTELERTMSRCWSQLLEVEPVGVHDDFFELGGDSLQAAILLNQLAAGGEQPLALPLRELFLTPTIAGLADRLGNTVQSDATGALAPIVRISRDGELPLSLNQEALWFLDRLEPDRPTYLLHLGLNVRGPVNLSVLERTLNEIARRHEVLRTTFPESQGRPVQLIAATANRALSVVDLSPVAAAERETELRRRISAEMRQPLDLQRGPLIRITMWRRAPDDYAAVISTHHIIHDGWSMGILLHELSVLYPAFAAGRPSPLPELPIQYVDFSAWQRRRLQGDNLERLRGYWLEKLRGVPPLELPRDFPRPAVRTTRGSSRPCRLSPETSAAVREFCRREGVTPYMTLLAAFGVLLARHSGQTDFAVGTPVANRNRPETEPLIGYFVNVVVVRTDLGGNPTFREAVARVRQVALEAFEHQELTLDKVVDAVKPQRDLSRNPLFQVMFALQNIRLPPFPETGIEISLLADSPAPPSANFDLTLELFERADGFQGSLNFSTDLFEPATIDRMAQQFPVLVAAAMREPERSVASLPLLEADQQREIVARWNATERDYDHTRLVHHRFGALAGRQPDAPAVVLDAQRWSYRELNERANQLAHHLLQWGVGPEVRVGLCLERSPQLVQAVLAVMKAGGAYVPLDLAATHSAAARNRFVLQEAQVALVLTDSTLAGALAALPARLLVLDGAAAETIRAESRSDVDGGAAAGNLAYIVYTSGSTGRPKGVMVTHGSLLNASCGWADEYRLDTLVGAHLQLASFGFDVFAGDLVRALCSGGSLVICRTDLLLDAASLVDLLQRERIVVAEFVPLALRHVVRYLEDSGRSPDSLRLVVVGSDAWYVADHRRARRVLGPHTRLINSYGLTEATIDSSCFEGDVHGMPDTAPVPIGRPFPNVRLHVLDDRQQPVPVGIPGELYVGGDGVARGYVNPELDATRFVPDPFAPTATARLCRSGDCARRRADGQIELLGRVDDQVKIRGFRVEPGEVGQLLREHPHVAEAEVIVHERTAGDLRLVAYVVGRGAVPPDPGSLKHFLAERVPDYLLPSAFVVLSALPTTLSGKVDRQALPEPDWGQVSSPGEFVAPRTPTEEQIAAIWCALLNLPRVSSDGNFFDLGGNSLLALRLAARIRQVLSVELPLVQLFTAPTIAELATVVDQLRDSGATFCTRSTRRPQTLVPLRTGGAARPLFCMPGLGGHAAAFVPLARALAEARPVYGLQGRGLDPEQEPHDTIADMAAYFLEEIRDLLPEGPYLLCGWSLGGLIALEAAQQLSAAGQDVGLVALLDSHLSVADFEDVGPGGTSVLRRVAPLLELPLAELQKLPLDQLWERIAGQARRTEGLGMVELRRLAAVCRAQLGAAARYQPQRYPGRTVLFQAGRGRSSRDPRWNLLCPQLVVESVPGDHYSMLLQPDVAVLAQRLEAALRQATA